LEVTPDQLRASYERVWLQVRPGIPAAQVEAAHMLTAPLTQTDVDRIYRKGERGWLEHEAGILRMDTDQVLVEARAEIDDLVWYLAFRSARLRGTL
jgi:hypothetical protein